MQSRFKLYPTTDREVETTGSVNRSFEMLDPFSIANSTIVGERLYDGLPCHECGGYGPIYIVEREGHTYDLCHGCAVKAGLKW